jgi:hypothetical protein
MIVVRTGSRFTVTPLATWMAAGGVSRGSPFTVTWKRFNSEEVASHDGSSFREDMQRATRAAMTFTKVCLAELGQHPPFRRSPRLVGTPTSRRSPIVSKLPRPPVKKS